jgi:hypothetical protein
MIGLNAEPGWRRACVVRSNWLRSKSQPPTSARISPLPISNESGGRLVADALYSTGASYTISISSSYGYPQNVNDHHLFVLRGYLVTEE